MATQAANASTPEERPANSLVEIEKRVSLGQVSWAGPLVLLTARTVLAVAVQALVAAVYVLRHNLSPWRAAAPWWTVYGTLVDIGCLALMVQLTRNEGIRLRDLVGNIRLRWGRDIFVGIGWLLLVFPFFMVGSSLGSQLVFGSSQPHLYPGLLAARTLPRWATIYSLSVWWIIWSPTEEMTYQAYTLLRIWALSRRWWVAIPVVAFWWTLQHSFIPLILDWHYVVWRFLAFLPGVTAFTLIYAWTKRLPPIILAHWVMDILAVLITLRF
jgi:membrane protease YdiL (CAAX protease family)